MARLTYGLVDYLAPEEISLFFGHIKRAFRPISYVLLVTGARFREAALLEWNAIDPNRMVMRFVHTKKEAWRRNAFGERLVVGAQGEGQSRLWHSPRQPPYQRIFLDNLFKMA